MTIPLLKDKTPVSVWGVGIVCSFYENWRSIPDDAGTCKLCIATTDVNSHENIGDAGKSTEHISGGAAIKLCLRQTCSTEWAMFIVKRVNCLQHVSGHKEPKTL